MRLVYFGSGLCTDLAHLVHYCSLGLFVSIKHGCAVKFCHSEHFILVSSFIKYCTSDFLSVAFFFKIQEGMIGQFIEVYPVTLVSLKALGQKKGALD